MRRKLRWVFSAVTGLSLLLCIATTVAWVRGKSTWDALLWRNPEATLACGFVSSDGCILFAWNRYTPGVFGLNAGFSHLSSARAWPLSNDLCWRDSAYTTHFRVGRLWVASFDDFNPGARLHGRLWTAPCW